MYSPLFHRQLPSAIFETRDIAERRICADRANFSSSGKDLSKEYKRSVIQNDFCQT
jgi:hypothetical protein